MILVAAIWLAAAPQEQAPAAPEPEAPSVELLLYLGEFDDETDPEELTDTMATEPTDDEAQDNPPR